MQHTLTKLFAEIKPRRLVETGTHLGMGTTTMLYNAVSACRDEFAITTIECNPHFHLKALAYFESKAMVEVRARLGLSVPRSLLPDKGEIKHEYVDQADTRGGTIYYDHDPARRVELYHAETNFDTVPDDLLGHEIKSAPEPIDVFLLDSAGHIGELEFYYMMTVLAGCPDAVPDPFYLILDDTRHCKHVKTLAYLKTLPGCEVLVDSADRFGWAVAKLPKSCI